MQGQSVGRTCGSIGEKGCRACEYQSIEIQGDRGLVFLGRVRIELVPPFGELGRLVTQGKRRAPSNVRTYILYFEHAHARALIGSNGPIDAPQRRADPWGKGRKVAGKRPAAKAEEEMKWTSAAGRKNRWGRTAASAAWHEKPHSRLPRSSRVAV